jgi:hypothetical protein
MVIEDTAAAGSESRIDHLLSRVSILFVSAVWIPATVCAIFLFGGGTSWATPAALTAVAAFLLLCFFLFRDLERKELILIAALTLLLVLVSAAGCIFIKDTSFDGRWYHASAILALLRGIDPLYEVIPTQLGNQLLYANHYPKATWYFAALTIHTFHEYQLGKLYNPLLILASAFYAFVFFGRFGMRRSYRWLLTLIVLLSPVPLSQWTTYYADDALGSLMTIVIMATVALLVRANRLDRILFVLSASLLVAIKFTGLVYIVIAAFFLIGGSLALKHRNGLENLRRELLTDLALVSAAIGLGVLVLGYDPYVTNLEQGHHLFYPVMGKEKLDLVAGNLLPQFREHPSNRFQQLFVSLFSRAMDNQRGWTELKVPFSLHAGELAGLARPDARIEGFGVFFSGALVACLILFLAVKGWRRNSPLLFGVLLIVVSTLSNPMCWWARYVPQLSLLPIFLLLPAFQSKSTQVRFIALILGLILLTNNFISAGVATGAAFIRSEKLTHGFETAAKVGGSGEYWAYRGSGEVAQLHYEQLSGFKGIIICGQVDAQKTLPTVGVFPIAIDRKMVTEVTLVKGSCSSGPPF